MTGGYTAKSIRMDFFVAYDWSDLLLDLVKKINYLYFNDFLMSIIDYFYVNSIIHSVRHHYRSFMRRLA